MGEGLMSLFKTPNLTSFNVPKAHMPRFRANYRVRFTNRGHRVVSYMNRWKRAFLFKAGASLKTWAIKSMKRVVLPVSTRTGKPLDQRGYHSDPPRQPFAHKKKKDFLRRAIQFGVSLPKENVLIGPVYSRAKLWGWKHEHGGTLRDKKGSRHYPKRAFMGPALQAWLRHRFGFRKTLERAKEWAFKS